MINITEFHRAILLWFVASIALAQVKTTDDLAAKVEELGARDGVVEIGKGDFKLLRPVTCSKGTRIVGAGGFADRGRGTNIQQAFDGDYMFRWNAGGGGIKDVSLTVAPNKKAGVAIFLDGTKAESRPTWFQIENVVVPKYSGMPAFKTGLLADGSAHTTAGSQGVRDLTIIGLYVYGATEHAIRFNRVVNVSILGGSCGPAGDGRAKMEFSDCDSIHVSAHTLWGDLLVQRSKNVSWVGGRLDGVTESANTDTLFQPCNKPKVKP